MTTDQTELKSKCCQANMSIGGDDIEGTHYYVCSKCKQATDPDYGGLKLCVKCNKSQLEKDIYDILYSKSRVDGVRVLYEDEWPIEELIALMQARALPVANTGTDKDQLERDRELLEEASNSIRNAGMMRVQKYWDQTQVKDLLAAKERVTRSEIREKINTKISTELAVSDEAKGRGDVHIIPEAIINMVEDCFN
jgi:hypothetical protein